MPDSAAWALGFAGQQGEIPLRFVGFVVLLLSVMGYLAYRELFAAKRGNKCRR